MRFYVAARFDAWRAARQLIEEINRGGHVITMDWTPDAESVFDGELTETTEVLGLAAENCIRGVETADCIIILLPGGRGSHVELGIALANHKPTVIYGTPDAIDGPSGYACPFYCLDTVAIVTNPMPWVDLIGTAIQWTEECDAAA